MVSARKRIWGWYFFDWASQPYNTLLLTFIFGPYFAEVARAHFTAGGADPEAAKAMAQTYWSAGLTITGIVIAFLSPVLGAIADGAGRKMMWIWLFSTMYVVGSFMLWWTLPTLPTLAWPVFWFSLGFVGMEMATNFTNALMPDLAEPEELGKISGTGFAFGYVGGVLALVVMLMFFAQDGDSGKTLIGLSPALGLDAATNQGTRAVGPFTAIWFIAFMIPFALWVREPPTRGPRRTVIQSLGDLWHSIRALGQRRSLGAFLLSSMFYRDSLNAVYGLGGAYASNAMGWSVVQSGTFGVLAAVTAAVFSWLGGRLDARFGPKVVIIWSILALTAVVAVMVGLTPDSLFGVQMAAGSAIPDLVFYLCGAVIGAAGGTIQAASRTLMVYHITPETAASGFGLYGLSGKATAFVGPALVSATTYVTGSYRIGISPLIGLFLLGMILLLWVNPKGERV
ncbi:MAG: MFS transporter [Paracoccaceae bacterium]